MSYVENIYNTHNVVMLLKKHMDHFIKVHNLIKSQI